MGLNMLQWLPGCPGKSRQGSHLIDNEILDLLACELHLPSPEALQVGKTGMSTDTYLIFYGQGHGFFHHHEISGVEPAGNVGRGDVAQHFGVQTEFISTEALTYVRIEIYLDHLFHPQCYSTSST